MTVVENKIEFQAWSGYTIRWLDPFKDTYYQIVTSGGEWPPFLVVHGSGEDDTV